VTDPLHPNKSIPGPCPNFLFDGAVIQPQESHKFLGMYFDQELCWNIHAERTIAKAAKWTLLFCRLTKPSTDVKLDLMRYLYHVVAIPKLTYAANVWFTPINKKEGK